MYNITPYYDFRKNPLPLSKLDICVDCGKMLLYRNSGCCAFQVDFQLFYFQLSERFDLETPSDLLFDIMQNIYSYKENHPQYPTLVGVDYIQSVLIYHFGDSHFLK